MHSAMTQERLAGLVTIAFESDILEKINYNAMIKEFISRNTRRIMLFDRLRGSFYYFRAIYLLF
jgi:hypothetical protein